MDRSFCIKNKLKSEILNTKKYKPKCLSAITKNLRIQLLLKDRMELKMKNVNITGVNEFLGEEGSQKTIYMRNCLKRERCKK